MKLLRKVQPFAAVLGLLLSLATVSGEEPPATPPAAAEAAKAAKAEDGQAVTAPAAPDAPDPTSDTDDDHGSGALNIVGQNVHVHKGEKVRSVVVNQGSAIIDGEVEENVVVVNGKLQINGLVHGNVVDIGHGIVLGTGARVGGDAVAILGGIAMGTNSVIKGDAVGILGAITQRPGAHVGGNSVPIALPNFADLIGQDGLDLPDWLARPVHQLVFKARPLAFTVGWSWMVAMVFALGYAVLLALFPKPVAATARTLDERGVSSFLMGLLALPLLAFLTLILVATGVGLVVVPFLFAAFVLAVLFGKAGLLSHLGGALLRQSKGPAAPFAALLVGLALVSVFYVIPFVGLLAWTVLTMWGLGAALLALFSSFRKERAPAMAKAAAPAAAPAAATMPLAATFPVAVAPVRTESSYMPTPTPTPTPAPAAAAAAAPIPTPAPEAPAEPFAPTIPPVTPAGDPAAAPAGSMSHLPPAMPTSTLRPLSVPAPLPEALTLPRVALGRRVCATVLDWVLLLFVVHGPILGWLPHFMLLHWLLFLAYFIGFYVWKSTTLGGLVLGLKVVRLDGRKIDFPCALVRSLGAVFSVIAAGIGYFWCAWDPEKQTWHDKLAGTIVVKLEKSLPLV
ncbi:MAG TPA: RDD family protein [Candidatus Limnocylindria bacterium]|nr:RDD family protein [Candidatus Limnocylindria bacterium]